MTRSLRGAIVLPSGLFVRTRALRRPLPAGPTPQLGLYLGSERARRRHDGALAWEHSWIDWPDFTVPAEPDVAAASIAALHRSLGQGLLVEVACGGGVGRTGTVVACLAVLDGLEPALALSWAREHHHPRAAETRAQRRWVAWFAEHAPTR